MMEQEALCTQITVTCVIQNTQVPAFQASREEESRSIKIVWNDIELENTAHT